MQFKILYNISRLEAHLEPGSIDNSGPGQFAVTNHGRLRISYLRLMKSVLTLCILIITHICYAQKMLIPYRSGKLFGLSDENGKIIVVPQYGHVKWMQGAWFSCSKKIELKDTLETSPRNFYIRNTEVELTGLINNGKIILKDEPFDDYEIIAEKCIVAEFQGRGTDLTKEQFKKYGNQRKLYAIFNLQGQNLYPENFRRIEKIDTAGISTRDKKTARYILFTATHFDGSYSLFVFDADQQKISDWLIKDAQKIDPSRYRISDKQIGFTITDKFGSSNGQILDYKSGKFVLRSATATTTTTPSRNQEKRIEEVRISEIGSGSVSDVAVPVMEEGNSSSEKPKFDPFYIVIRDTLFYLTSYENKHPVQLSPGDKIILTRARGNVQNQSVIVKRGNLFYIVKEDKPGTVAYDSLIYFGNNFIAWRQIDGQTKAGVINSTDSIIVPMEYDSIYADIRLFNLKDRNPAGKSNYQIELAEADSKYDYNNTYPYKRTPSGLLTVFKNGKCGVINLKGETIIPIQYEMIAQNNLQHSLPRQDEFILLKQDNHYGLAALKYNNEKKRTELFFFAKPVFEYIPGFFYPNYYGLKDYKLIGLYNEQMEFKGYASEKGTQFYKD